MERHNLTTDQLHLCCEAGPTGSAFRAESLRPSRFPNHTVVRACGALGDRALPTTRTQLTKKEGGR